jgi:hypothetical protein
VIPVTLSTAAFFCLTLLALTLIDCVRKDSGADGRAFAYATFVTAVLLMMLLILLDAMHLLPPGYHP